MTSSEHVLSPALSTFSAVVGWGYFLAWSLSFYPQNIENFWRKSVVGLSFDFLTLNIIGHTSYLIFNSVLFWDPTMKAEYEIRHGSANVQPNDVFFSIHAVTLTAITIFQCIIYERGGQTISNLARGISLTLLLSISVAVFLALGTRIQWVDFLKFLGIVKLIVTTIKYIPQAFINYKRQLTIGWSIGNILLDFSGGALSIFQMVIDGINTGDWSPFYGDFVKTGLGFLSIAFDIIFMVQHYILYRKNNKEYYAKLRETKKLSIYEEMWDSLKGKILTRCNSFINRFKKNRGNVANGESNPLIVSNGESFEPNTQSAYYQEEATTI